MTWIIIIIVTLTLVSYKEVQGQLFNGEDIGFMVTIEYQNKPICSGSIISSVHVITAAQCTQRNEKDLLVHTLTKGPKPIDSFFEILRIISHPEYKLNPYGSQINDVALIRVRSSFNRVLHGQIFTVKLADSKIPIISGSTTRIVRYSESSLALKDYLIVDTNVCNGIYHGRGFVDDTQICGVGYRSDFDFNGPADVIQNSCLRHAGDPIIVERVIIGLTSWGDGCGDENYPVVYTQISHYRDWILNQTKY
ncbi:hypothetical protein QAD02_006372 [Eretmocerus hayati]|uniref:Uncharacterized protein n=1 Tax=Eretmocerus hayati TaxID=131215 RepID=A0ACC2N4V7_9HYME|nr:hypothetical protein QAD02_006372 [Eretmocerus hayati]